MGFKAACAAILSLAVWAGAAEQVTVTISDPVSGANGHPVVAYNSTSNQYLVTWLNRSEARLYGRVLKPAGTAVTAPFAITPGNKSAGEHYAVAYNSDEKEFLVVWESATTGAGATNMFVQRVSPQGALKGSSRKIAGEAKKLNWMPAVAYNAADNHYLVVWSKEALQTADGGGLPPSPDGIYRRFISAAGTPIGTESLLQQMSYETKSDYLYHLGYSGFSLQVTSDGGRYGLLADRVLSTAERNNMAVYFISINAAGERVGNPVKVSKAAVGARSAFTALAENSLTEKWMAAWETVQKDEGRVRGRIYTRVLNSSGTPSTAEQRTFDNEEQSGQPSLAFNPDKGNFLLILDADTLVQHGANWDVLGQYLSANGSKSGRTIEIADDAEIHEAEHSLFYNPVAKNFFVVYASAVDENTTRIYGTFLTPQ